MNTSAWRVDQLVDPGADGAELLDEVEAVGGGGAEAGGDLLLQARDPHLEELVEVLAEDGEELGPLEQRQRGRSSASASTRALNSSHESSRLRKRSEASANGGRSCATCGEAVSSPATGQCVLREFGRPIPDDRAATRGAIAARATGIVREGNEH